MIGVVFMKLWLTGHSYRYECENLCRLFFPYSPVRVTSLPEQPAGEPWAWVAVSHQNNFDACQVRASDGQTVESAACQALNLCEYDVTRLLFQTLCKLTGLQPAWGMLTGVHPIKLLRMCCQGPKDFSLQRGFDTLRLKWSVSEAKADLAKRTLSAQLEPVSALTPRDFCLYVSIPFCPTRCSYCSFVSQDIQRAGALIPQYLELLSTELSHVGSLAKQLGLSPISIYIGGGTPTTLSAEQLQSLCSEISQRFDLSRCAEFTVEAGRPDTITKEKLDALSKAGVTRISINPQSLSDQVLRNIGRMHNAADVQTAFDLAHTAGFTNINADLIVGLPGDDYEGFCKSLDGVYQLGANNITVHSLALKRSAEIVVNQELSSHKGSALAAQMVDHSIHQLSSWGFEPYYLYRQTRMAGNLENTGWALPGTACRYNIYTMDESLTVIACGAGAISKIKDPFSDALTRIFNFKYPYEYISRFGEILERKDGIKELYEQFC